MTTSTHSFTAPLWAWESDTATWFFLTIPPALAAEIRALPRPRRGFGSVRVRVQIGSSSWSTSVFPLGADDLLLPVKRSVRDAEGISRDDEVDVTLTLV